MTATPDNLPIFPTVNWDDINSNSVEAIVASFTWSGQGDVAESWRNYNLLFAQATSDADDPNSLTIAQQALPLAAAAMNGCPVPREVIFNKGWYAAAMGYESATAWYIDIVSNLPSNSVKYQYLTEFRTRLLGEKYSYDWPISAEQEASFLAGISGPGNYAGYALTRLLRDARVPNNSSSILGDSSPVAIRTYLRGMMEFIVSLPEEEIEGELDFILQVGEEAVRLGADPQKVLNHVLSFGYLVEENSLHQLWNEALYTINLPRGQAKFAELAKALPAYLETKNIPARMREQYNANHES